MSRLIKPRYRRAFTLPELLVVVAVVMILVGLALPMMGRAKEAARIAVCGSNQSQIGKAGSSFATDRAGNYIPKVVGTNPPPKGSSQLVCSTVKLQLGTSGSNTNSGFAFHASLWRDYFNTASKALFCPSAASPGFEFNDPEFGGVQLAPGGTNDVKGSYFQRGAMEGALLSNRNDIVRPDHQKQGARPNTFDNAERNSLSNVPISVNPLTRRVILADTSGYTEPRGGNSRLTPPPIWNHRYSANTLLTDLSVRNLVLDSSFRANDQSKGSIYGQDNDIIPAYLTHPAGLGGWSLLDKMAQ